MKQFEYHKVKRPSQSTHDLSFEYKTCVNMGRLVPITLQETLPGDKFSITNQMLLRMQPMIAPIMHRVNAYIHHFFVPKRILWDEFEDFVTGGRTGQLLPNVPKITGLGSQFVQQWYTNSLADYMGIPVPMFEQALGNNFEFSALPFRAYQQIFNDYYIDPMLDVPYEFETDSNDRSIGSDPDAIAISRLQTRCWEKDYFTSLLATPQLGDAVTLPLGVKAPVVLEPDFNNHEAFWVKSSGIEANNGDAQISDFGGLNHSMLVDSSSNQLWYDPNSTLYTDLENATQATINDLRRSFALQRWLEKNSRAGHRYFEQMKSHFGISSPDSRLQRAEYIGGGKMPVKVSEVLQTSDSQVGSPQGNMAGHAFANGQSRNARYTCLEHGYIISILSIMPRTAYMQGVPKVFRKFDRFQLYWPEFAHIGEEEVNTEEIYMEGIEGYDTLGYQPRYEDYRYNYDRVTGRMRRDGDDDGLNFWHLARKFDHKPVLNATFTRCNPTNRIWPIDNDSYDELIVQIFNSIRAIRSVVKYGTPI